MMKKLFSEFKQKTKAEWLAKVEQDLKGKPIENLTWQLENGLSFSPFPHAEDLREHFPPLAADRKDNTWEIGYFIKVEDFKKANEEALQALKNGANALFFQLKNRLHRFDLGILLSDIQHEWISTNFSLKDENQELIFSDFWAIVKEKKQDPAKVRCSFSFEKNQIEDTALLEKTLIQFPQSSLMTVNAKPYFKGKEGIVDELAQTLTAANQLLIHLNEKGIDLAKVYSTIQFSLIGDDSYFLTIAKIRALKILWQQVLSAWHADFKNTATIEIHLTAATQTDNENYNKIKATTQAMSAVIGGADRLFVHASDKFKDGNGTAFGKRIALNIQHLLQLESYLDRVVDPAAGSYYLEQMTETLAEAAWNIFTKN